MGRNGTLGVRLRGYVSYPMVVELVATHCKGSDRLGLIASKGVLRSSLLAPRAPGGSPAVEILGAQQCLTSEARQPGSAIGG